MKAFYSKIWILALLFLSPALLAQVKEPQAGDTTYYKTLIPAEMNSRMANIPVRGSLSSSSGLKLKAKYMTRCISAFAIGIPGHRIPSQWME
jgi:hypothetical protein